MSPIEAHILKNQMASGLLKIREGIHSIGDALKKHPDAGKTDLPSSLWTIYRGIEKELNHRFISLEHSSQGEE